MAGGGRPVLKYPHQPRMYSFSSRIRFSVRSAHAFASGFFSVPLMRIQLPLATLRRYLTGAGLASLIYTNFPIGLTP